MLNVFQVEDYLSLAVGVVLLAVKIFVLVNCLTFSAESYTAANRLTKPAWGLILALGLVLQIFMVGSSPISPLNLVFTIAALVYLADVRPALSGLRRR